MRLERRDPSMTAWSLGEVPAFSSSKALHWMLRDLQLEPPTGPGQNESTTSLSLRPRAGKGDPAETQKRLSPTPQPRGPQRAARPADSRVRSKCLGHPSPAP